MATTQFKKVIIIGHKDQKEKLLDKIHKLGFIEVIKSSIFDSLNLEESKFRDQRDLDPVLKELQCSIDFLKGFEGKRSLFEGLIQKKPILDFDRIDQITDEFDRSLFYKEVDEIGRAKKELDIETERFIQRKNEVLPWIKLSIPLQEIGYTEYTSSHIGTVRKDKLLKFKEELTKAIPDLVVKEIDETASLSFLYILYLKTEEERVSSLLKRHGFNYVYLSGLRGTPKEVLEMTDKELAEIERKRLNLFEKAKSLLDKKEKVFILYDYFNNLKKRELVSENFLYTKDTFILEGWIRRRDIERLTNEAKLYFSNIEIIIKSPSKMDKVPVELENNKVYEPFEFITKIYGMPAHGEVDPTPFLAPFFFIFFGFCLSDAGYGIIVSLLSWFILRNFKMGPQGKKFFKLFFYCGISSTVIGALTGSWFGNIVDVMAESGLGPLLFLKDAKDSIVVLDPQKEPMKLLIAALFLGVVQIWCGHIVAIYGNLKNRRFLDALLDQGSMLLFLLGFTGLLLCFFGVFGKITASIFLKIFVAGSLFIVLTQGRSNPGLGSKLFFGIYTLYNAFSGYISDILSYSRLWALGLVTGVMAYTCNLMAVMIGGMVPYIGVLFTILILVLGHFFTLVMNLLGAFVHPVRLQFVEFFSKFFKGGGRSFRPLRIESRYTML